MSAANFPASASGAATGIRPVRPSDFDELERIESLAFATDRLSRRSLRTLARSPSACLLVAARAGQVLGYALVLTRRGSRAARLYSLAVHPDFGGRGIGARLLAAAEAAARRRGAERLRLEVRADNTAAIAFYERRGYAFAGRREGYYEDGAAAFRYTRRLDAAPAAAGRRLGRAA